jgi:hypothetical protein
MYGGFAAAWYAVLVAGYVWTFGDQGNHVLAALGFFLFLPGLFGGLCGLCMSALTEQAKATLRKGLEAGVLTRRQAFVTGVMAGAVSMAGVVGVGLVLYPLRDSEVCIVLGLLGVAVILGATPFLGWWFLRRCADFKPGAESSPGGGSPSR